MRRLAIIGIGGALWLLLAAIPVLADGGPHVMSYNNGSAGISADGCASCHRIHTSQSPTGYLLTSNDTTVTEFCRSCHGVTGTGASTDVDTGVQYALAGIARDTGTTIGALRGGGFVKARIGSDAAYRLVSDTGSVSNSKVPVAAGSQPVTSAHLALGAIADGGNGLTAKNVVWGMGPISAVADPGAVGSEMECTSCHNPHGNGNYRILYGQPDPGVGVANPDTRPTVDVMDATFDPARTRNYSVIQVAGTPGVDSTYLLYADQVLAARAADSFLGIAGDYDALSGDYLHKNVPYDVPAIRNVSPTWSYDGPNARPNTSATSGLYTNSSSNGFNVQMTKWCAQCHTRYMAPSGSRLLYSGDVIFSYRHTTAQNRTCTTCHVAHGTNAVMNQVPANGTTYSANVPYPDGTTTVGDSRLLKVDNRGTCQLCHDPTDGSATRVPDPDVTSIEQGPHPSFRP